MRIEIFTNTSLWEDRHHTIDPARKRHSSKRAGGKPSMQHGDGIAISNTISHHPAIYPPIAEQSIVCVQLSAMLARLLRRNRRTPLGIRREHSMKADQMQARPALAQACQGDEINHPEPMHSLNDPSNGAIFNQTLVRLTTNRFDDMAPFKKRVSKCPIHYLFI